MPGVRLHHPTLRGAIWMMEIPERPYPVPFLCTTCQRPHLNKAVHLRLDMAGDVCVAPETYEIIREHLDPEFRVLGEVSKPPPMFTGWSRQIRERARRDGPEHLRVIRMEDTHG